MRVGQNPARFIETVAQPAEITVAVVNFIPFLGGYYEQSLEILKATVESLHATRDPEHPYDVMVFDNHSCAEVRAYLMEASQQGKVQYLVLSDTNIGKLGSWNYMFGAAQGKYVAFADGDILFRPGWLKASLELFETFPNVGMVTARPMNTPREFSTSTFEWAEQEKILEEGPFLDGEVYLEHARSLRIQDDSVDPARPRTIPRVSYAGKMAYVGAAHFQFMAPREVLQKVMPISSEKPMRGERILDTRINDLKLLRLTTTEPFVAHLGNRLVSPVSKKVEKKGLLHRFIYQPLIRRPLLWIHNQIFRLYFLNEE